MQVLRSVNVQEPERPDDDEDVASNGKKGATEEKNGSSDANCINCRVSVNFPSCLKQTRNRSIPDDESNDLDQTEDQADGSQNDPGQCQARNFLEKLRSIKRLSFLATTFLAPWMRRDAVATWAMPMIRRIAIMAFVPAGNS